MKKKQLSFQLLLAALCWLNTFGQIQKEYETHLKSISEISLKTENTDSNLNAKALVDYTMLNLLQNPSDKYFISNRSLLKPLKTNRCDSASVQIQDVLQNGKKLELEVQLSPFIEKNHTLRKSVDSTMIYRIDNIVPYGAAYQVPRFEITTLSLKIAGKNLVIPKAAYQDLYRLNMCNLNGFFRGIEVYESLNGQYIYLYMFGGTPRDVWFAKLVFDHEKYITRIIADYYVLNLHGSFREDFVGF